MLREIIEENNVAIKIDASRSMHPRIDDVLDGLKWRLSRQPEDGVLVPGSENQYIVKLNHSKLRNLPGILVLYTFDQDQVILHDIEIRPADFED